MYLPAMVPILTYERHAGTRINYASVQSNLAYSCALRHRNLVGTYLSARYK